MTARPAGHLSPYVHSYVGYRYEGFAAGTHLGLPSHHLTVIFSLGPATRLAEMPDPDQAPGAFTTLASGLTTRKAVITHHGDQYGIQLRFSPAGARALLGVTSGALGASVVDLDELMGTAATEMVERMVAMPSWNDRFALLDDVFTRRLGRLRPTTAELTRAWQRIVGSGGTVRIGDLAADVGWSRRHLAGRFTSEYGITPKDAARVVRFERSRTMLARADRPTFAAVAAACGYYDQSHLDREWGDFASCPPSAWIAGEDLPFVQDTPAAADAS